MSNLVLRVLSAAVGIPFLLFAGAKGGWWLVSLIAALQLLLLWEWKGLARGAGAALSVVSLLLATIGLDLFVFLHGSDVGKELALLALCLWSLSVLFVKDRAPLRQLGFGALFLLYAALPLALWFALHEQSDAHVHGIIGAVGTLFISTWLCDSGAYFCGRAFGKHKLFPAASPNKTVEGALGGLVASALLLPALQALNLAAPRWPDYFVLPLIVGIAGQLGDLLESLMKREIMMKDSSQLIPGHGGVLDRFDSLLLSTPLFLAYTYYLKP